MKLPKNIIKITSSVLVALSTTIYAKNQNDAQNESHAIHDQRNSYNSIINHYQKHGSKTPLSTEQNNKTLTLGDKFALKASLMYFFNGR